MGFLSKLSKGEILETAEEDNYIEELYQKLFAKIARDFIVKEDMQQMQMELLQRLFIFSPAFYQNFQSENFNLTASDNAIKKAHEYKDNLKRPFHKRRKYKDII